jgi:hypothetical protein
MSFLLPCSVEAGCHNRVMVFTDAHTIQFGHWLGIESQAACGACSSPHTHSSVQYLLGSHRGVLLLLHIRVRVPVRLQASSTHNSTRHVVSCTVLSQIMHGQGLSACVAGLGPVPNTPWWVPVWMGSPVSQGATQESGIYKEATGWLSASNECCFCIQWSKTCWHADPLPPVHTSKARRSERLVGVSRGLACKVVMTVRAFAERPPILSLATVWFLTRR